jgi:zinc/manganese transport system substrate-binding protein
LLLLALLLVGCAAPAATPTAVPAAANPTPTTATAGTAATTPTTAPSPTVAAPTATAATASVPAAAAAKPAVTPAKRLSVVATFSILGDLVKSVGGDRVEVALLVGPGQDAHTFQPSPADGAKLARADLFFENGLGFEGWLEELYRASGSKARRVVVTEGIAAQKGGQAHAEGEGEAGHTHGEFDPHVWQDVRLASHMVGRIGEALAQADPAGAALYKGNAERYQQELRALDAWVVEQVQSLPEARRTLVTNHDSLGYFASRYGFAILGTAMGGVSTEASEPAAADLAKLIRRIKSAQVPAIFVENVANPKLMERIAREAGVAVAPPLYTDALGPPGSPVDSYPKMVRHNVSTIVAALRA